MNLWSPQAIKQISGACALLAFSTTGPVRAAHAPVQSDARDLAALFLFNGESGQRAYDMKGAVGGEDALWKRVGAGWFQFTTTRFGVVVHGAKVVDVTTSCRILVNTKLSWQYPNRLSETLERSEEYDFSKSVVSDAIQALKPDGEPYATVLIMHGHQEFHCVETRINGLIVEPRHCNPRVDVVAGPGARSEIIRSGFRRFSDDCKSR